VLSYFEEYDAFKLMQTSIINDVMMDLIQGESQKEGEFLADSTMFKISQQYEQEMFRDFENDISPLDKSAEQEFIFQRNVGLQDLAVSKSMIPAKQLKKEENVLVHGYSFQIFIDTVEIKLTIDMYIYLAVVLTSIIFMIVVAMEFGAYFLFVGTPFYSAVAWQNLIAKMENGIEIDKTSQDYLLTKEFYPGITAHVQRLAMLYTWSFIFVSVTTLCSFRTPVNMLFAKLTDRAYKVTEVTYVDAFVLCYFVFYMIIVQVYSDEQYTPQFLIDEGIVNAEQKMERFSAVMLLQAETKSGFRFDYATAVFAVANCAKAILQLSYTQTFGPLIKMVQVMSSQLLIFMVVWISLMLLFVCIGNIIFYEIIGFADPFSSLITLI
jgi:hypothetical protein